MVGLRFLFKVYIISTVAVIEDTGYHPLRADWQCICCGQTYVSTMLWNPACCANVTQYDGESKYTNADLQSTQ
jgi:hypothetical protein